MEFFQILAIALGLGLLVGLQREWSAPHVAGIRTFAFITVLGAVAAVLGHPWVMAAGLIALAALLVVGNFLKAQTETDDLGLTTAVAALLMYCVGALLAKGYTAPAIAVGGGVAVLLHWKQPLHRVVERIGAEDIRGIIRLTLIGLVLLPVLPNKSYGPYEVLNPFEIWLLVVLIVGISLSGYIVYKFLGAKVGAVIGGVLGGIISSTATTVSYAKQSRDVHRNANLSAIVLMIASTIVFVRVLFEIGVVAPNMLADVAPPLIAMMLYMAVISIVTFLVLRDEPGDIPQPKDPSQLRSAIIFGAMYAVVLLGVAGAKEHLGDSGLYLVAAASGLTDMDAITLSVAQFVNVGKVDADMGWRLILVGAMANLVFKAVIVAILGNRALLKRISLLFGISLAGGALIVLLWP